MNRRKLFSFLALTPVGVIMAREEVAAKEVDVPVKVTPGEKCIHCGCPQHIMVPDLVMEPRYDHISVTIATTYQSKKVCSWCNLPWVGKKWKV